jgi:hAT family C-terminal dimerisation region
LPPPACGRCCADHRWRRRGLAAAGGRDAGRACGRHAHARAHAPRTHTRGAFRGAGGARIPRAVAASMKPWEWWETYGGDMPELREVAMHVLSKCTSASASERCWSAVEAVQHPKRARVQRGTMDDLCLHASTCSCSRRGRTPQERLLCVQRGRRSFRQHWSMMTQQLLRRRRLMRGARATTWILSPCDTPLRAGAAAANAWRMCAYARHMHTMPK